MKPETFLFALMTASQAAAASTTPSTSTDFYPLFAALKNYIATSSNAGILPILVRMSFHDVADFDARQVVKVV